MTFRLQTMDSTCFEIEFVKKPAGTADDSSSRRPARPSTSAASRGRRRPVEADVVDRRLGVGEQVPQPVFGLRLSDLIRTLRR